MLVNQIVLGRILSNKDVFTNEVWRVLGGLMCVIRYDGGTDITQQKLADMIGMHRPNVTRCIKILEENDIIYRDGRSWYIDDSLVFKGVEHEIGVDEDAPQ